MAPELMLSGASSILLIALVRCILFEVAVTALLICVVPPAPGIFWARYSPRNGIFSVQTPLSRPTRGAADKTTNGRRRSLTGKGEIISEAGLACRHSAD